MRVYCKGCKHYLEKDDFGYCAEYPPAEEIYWSGGTSQKRQIYQSAQGKNYNNRCKSYVKSI